jgi:membrane protease YdiL (CAAX protease family)
MKRLSKLSKYHLFIISVYIIVTPLIFIFAPSLLHYNFKPDGLSLAAITIILGFLGFHLLSTPQTVIYATILIAFPEEIIFRGVIQHLFQAKTGSIWITVLLSSLIYAAAHLLNGAKGFKPENWNCKFAALVFIAGIPLGLIFAITKSLLIPTLLHAVFVVCLSLSKNNSRFLTNLLH